MASEIEFERNMDPDFFYHNYRPNSELWRDQAVTIGRNVGLPAKSFRAFTAGVNLVAMIDEAWVIKIFPPFQVHQWESESRVLRALPDGLASVQIPKLRIAGELPWGWRFVVMSLVLGDTLDKVWMKMGPQEREQSLYKIGQIMAEVHDRPLGELHDLSPQWDLFIDKQIHQCFDRHQRLGMPVWFLRDLPKFISNKISLPSAFAPCLLTGEYTPFNLLVKSLDEPEIVSMIDFADSMIGPPEYDLLGPMLFLAAGDRTLIDAILKGYGWPTGRLSPELRRCLMSLQLLHRYSDFSEQLRIPWMDRVSSLEELEDLIWPL